MNKIIVYTKNGCQPCRLTKKILIKNSITFEEINIETDETAYEYILSKSYQQAPVVEILQNGTVVDSWTGLNLEKIAHLV